MQPALELELQLERMMDEGINFDLFKWQNVLAGEEEGGAYIRNEA